jgi:hypothetical protein
MGDFVLPVLGLGDEHSSPTTYVYRDGNVICRGILCSAFDPDAVAEREACAREIEHKGGRL